MPIYEYKRDDGTTFEIQQKMDEKPLERCPETGQGCKRIISGGQGTIFRGNNWPDKQVRAKKRRDPLETTLPEYRKKIKKNSEKAKEMKENNN